MKDLAMSVRARALSALGGAVAAALVLGAPAKATDPVSPEQLKLFNTIFMEWVVKGDRLFHGDAALEKEMGVTLSNTGMACAMCHPFAADTHPQSFPKFQVSMAKLATLRDMTNWCIEKPMQGEAIDTDSDAMKALEVYMYWSNTGSELVTGRY
jgi:thiosulfate dehydrogenase